MLHKILKILAAILGVLGLIFLVRIIAEGDDAIKSAAAMGDTSIVDPFAYVAYFIMVIAIVFVVVFMLKNLFTNTATLKNTLIGVGIFAAVLIIAYMVSGGDPKTYLYGGEAVSEGESHMVGAGLIAFYILIVTAAVAMLFSGVKKITSR
ncbi:hypothetical protein LRR18_00385 [Mangrovimonas sp. AS39]|uniref:hypothetical protein n=1 Tax=Mangrovimonas TaxID=1211036 RepID=UPI0006B40C43|nr:MULTISPECIES: hypothetical protein [Mangrovimonas]MCF1190023.1 hypothetical protein [Mangrovimonas futianensis]MCF1194226.1 hypothetical protein [Mangrovimonas futianensis]MCF1421693.1 hypothetical protein [Mangrovimonas futianensis]